MTGFERSVQAPLESWLTTFYLIEHLLYKKLVVHGYNIK